MLHRIAVVCVVVAAVSLHAGRAEPPACPPGCKIVEETVYKEICLYRCKVVPEIKKKWVYECVDAPFCIQSCAHGGCCGECAHCTGPHCRKQLVKRQIDWKCDVKCEVEKVVEVVPCKVYRVVPCAAPAPAMPLPSGATTEPKK
jgi:hypothetical protein